MSFSDWLKNKFINKDICQDAHTFKEPFLDFYTRCNSKTYYYLELLYRYDIPIVVHDQRYRHDVINECRNKFGINNPPIFTFDNENDFYKCIAGTKYRNKKFIVDDPIVLHKKYIPYIRFYTEDEIRELVLTYLAEESKC